MSILEDLDIAAKARKTLDRIANGEDVRLTAEQAKSLQQTMGWLLKERESLLSSGYFDD